MTDVRGWDSESGRSVAAVTWSSGSTNVYRVGHKGKVDLKYIQAASGGYYYKDHLPVLGKCSVTDKQFRHVTSTCLNSFSAVVPYFDLTDEHSLEKYLQHNYNKQSYLNII